MLTRLNGSGWNRFEIADHMDLPLSIRVWEESGCRYEARHLDPDSRSMINNTLRLATITKDLALNPARPPTFKRLLPTLGTYWICLDFPLSTRIRDYPGPTSVPGSSTSSSNTLVRSSLSSRRRRLMANWRARWWMRGRS